MVTTDEIVRICLRHDTYVSDRMLAACGTTRAEHVTVERPDPRYRGVMECFANRERLGYREAMLDG